MEMLGIRTEMLGMREDTEEETTGGLFPRPAWRELSKRDRRRT